MKKLAALALASAPLLASGCVAERVYDDSSFLEPALVAELFGQAGVVQNIEKRFSTEPSTTDLFAPSDSISVSDYGDEVYASMFVQQPDGRAYIDVNIANYDQMEPGEAYTVQLQGDGSSGEYYASDDVSGDEPQISVYACPEDVSGPTGQSGNAEEITVIREIGPNGRDVFTFQAQADNPRQELFLDGWFRTDPNNGGL